MTERENSRFRRIASRLLRFLFLILLLTIAVVIGSMLDPLTQIVGEIITTSTHTPTNTPTSTSTPTNTPTRLAKDSAKLSYKVLAPENAKLEYDAATGRGTVNWDHSYWMPTEPAGTAEIRYELSVTYPEFVLGPFIIDEENSYTFTALDAHRYETVIVSLRAVGTLQIDKHDYEFGSDIVEIVWINPTATPSFTPTLTYTPTGTPTATSTPTATNTPSATHTYTSTATSTNTSTNTPTPTHTFTPSDTPTPTSTDTPSRTPTPTLSFTPSDTNTPTYTYTPSTTPTHTLTPTETFTPSDTPTSTDTPTETMTFTPSATFTPDINRMDVQFEVITDGVVNIRRCPGTTCNPRLGVSRRGQVFEVFGRVDGTDGEWYLIRFENRPAYLAGWLTTRTSDATATSRAATATSRVATSRAQSTARARNSRATANARARKTESALSDQAIETDGRISVQFRDLSSTFCVVSPTINEVGSNLVIIAGDRKYSAELKIIPPGRTDSLETTREQVGEIAEAGSARFVFLNDAPFQPGIYTLRLEMAGTYYSTIYWRVRRSSNYTVVAACGT